MSVDDPSATNAPLSVVLLMLHFAVPEMMGPSEARLLCKGTASELAAPPFWRGFTVNIDRDERACRKVTRAPPTSRNHFTQSFVTTRTQSAGEDRNRGTGSSSGDGDTTLLEIEQPNVEVRSGKDFLQRYYHYTAFRSSERPVTETETVKMPASLSPTCLDVRGSMVAIGTREGSVLLFDIDSPQPAPPRSDNKPTGSPLRRKQARTQESGTSRSEGFPRQDRSKSLSEASDNGSGSGRCSQAARVKDHRGKSLFCLGRKHPGSDRCSLVRVYGSPSAGGGRITAILLDRFKLIAAGGRANRDGGGFVIRIYAVDSPRLIRTLLCKDEVYQLGLADPILAVLCIPSGNLSITDLYAPVGSGLGTRMAVRGCGVRAFAVAEPTDQSYGSEAVFHCANVTGGVFELTTSGSPTNLERAPLDRTSNRENEERATLQGHQVSVDMEASLMIRWAPWGVIAAWRLLPSGRRIPGCVFSFRCASQPFSSLHIARGGLFFATSFPETIPRMWDCRLTRSATPSSGAAASRQSYATGGNSAAAMRKVWRLESVKFEDAPDQTPRRRCLYGRRRWNTSDDERSPTEDDDYGDLQKPSGTTPWSIAPSHWPRGVWAVGVAIDTARGRLVSACSDGSMRITKIRPNTSLQSLRAAVLRGRDARLQPAGISVGGTPFEST